MARKGGSGGRRSGGNRKSGSKGAAKKNRQGGMRRNMRKGMRQFDRKGAVQKNRHQGHGVGSKMSNLKLGAAMATTAGAMSGRHGGVGQGGFGANEESQVEQELAYMSVYDHMDDDGDTLQHHLDILSIEG